MRANCRDMPGTVGYFKAAGFAGLSGRHYELACGELRHSYIGTYLVFEF